MSLERLMNTSRKSPLFSVASNRSYRASAPQPAHEDVTPVLKSMKSVDLTLGRRNDLHSAEQGRAINDIARRHEYFDLVKVNCGGHTWK